MISNPFEIFIDTSAFIAIFNKKDSRHPQAVQLFHQLKVKKTRLYTSDYVFDETITLLRMRENHSCSVIVADSIRESRVIKLVSVFDRYFQETCDLYKKYGDQRFSFTDVSSFVIMRELGIYRAFSFDKDFRQAGFELLR